MICVRLIYIVQLKTTNHYAWYTHLQGGGWEGGETKTMLEYKIVKMRPIKSASMWNYCPLISEDKRSLGGMLKVWSNIDPAFNDVTA